MLEIEWPSHSTRLVVLLLDQQPLSLIFFFLSLAERRGEGNHPAALFFSFLFFSHRADETFKMLTELVPRAMSDLGTTPKCRFEERGAGEETV